MKIALALLLACATAFAKPPKARWQTLPMPPAPPTPAATGTVESGDAKIFYATFGTGEPVVLLHGGLGNGDHFAFQIPALAEKYRVIAIDSRGQGRSTHGADPITYDRMAGDVVAVLDALKIERASFVGWSDGGEVALKLAIHFPKRVKKAFVFGANYNADGSKPRGNHTPTFQAYAQKCREDYARLAPGAKYDALVDALLPLWKKPTGITKKQLASIAAPVLMADGDHDEVIVLDQIREMAKLIPHATLEVFGDASHFALWQDPDVFNQTVLAFLGS